MSDWQQVPLKEIALTGRENFIDGDWIEAPYIAASGIRLIQTGNVGVGQFRNKAKKYISKNSFSELRCKAVLAGDILICRLAEPAGRACIVPEYLKGENITSVDVTIFRVNEEIYDKFFIVQSINTQEFLDRCQEVAGGTTRTRISRSNLGALTLHCPPLPQQKKIAKILTTVDNLIEQTQALIDKYTAIKQGIMADLFTRGLDITGTPATNPLSRSELGGQLRPSVKDAPELYKETELGLLPKDWSVRPLDTLLADVISPMRSGPFGSALLKHELVESGVPLLGIDNIHAEDFNGTFHRHVTTAKFSELKRYAVRPKDVVITIMGTVGRCCLIPENIDRALSSKHLWTMTFDKDLVIPELICWQLNYASWVLNWFANQSQGAVMEAIQSKTLKELLLPVPPMDEQRKILMVYMASSKSIGAEQLRIKKLERQKKGLMQDLLTGKVPVNA